MLSIVMAGMVAASCQSVRPIRFPAKASVPAGPLSLGAVADLSSLPASLRHRAISLQIGATVPGHGILPLGTIERRARALMPVLVCWLPHIASGASIQLEAAGGEPAPAPAASGAASPWRAGDAIHRGDHLHLTTIAGPVRVEREVEALQSARDGQRLFVRAADGQTLSVVYRAPSP